MLLIIGHATKRQPYKKAPWQKGTLHLGTLQLGTLQRGTLQKGTPFRERHPLDKKGSLNLEMILL